MWKKFWLFPKKFQNIFIAKNGPQWHKSKKIGDKNFKVFEKKPKKIFHKTSALVYLLIPNINTNLSSLFDL